jgi:hypothetical protein
VFDRLFKRQKPRVFLGAIAVADRTDLKRHLEQEIVVEDESLDSALRRTLAEIFSLPRANGVEDPLSTDLVLDIWIPKYQSGGRVDMNLGDAGITLLWRPKVTVSSRLYWLANKKTKAIFSVTEKMKWRPFLARTFSWRGLFGSPPFAPEDMEYLLCLACAKLLTKVQRAV